MRQLALRSSGLLARLPAGAEACAVASRATLVSSAQQGAISVPSAPTGGREPGSSAASSARAWRGWPRCFSAAAEPAAAAASGGKAEIVISPSAVERLKELGPDVVLRVMVEGGGCSGFQYEFSLDEAPKEDDRVFERDGVRVVCDDLSLEFLRGATVDYESDLMRSAFVINSNPNAASSCGCGSSFVAK